MYIMEYYSVIRENETMPFEATYMDLDISKRSEVREKQISYDITYV